jgi:hypothetical protein
MGEQTFKRGAALKAAWLLFKRSAPETEPQKIFRNRVKHLLDFDRTINRPRGAGPGAGYAFFDRPKQGTGNKVEYSVLDVFCLLVAIELIDLGFPQSEAIAFAREARPVIDHHFYKPESQPVSVPTFIVLTRSELTEAYEEEKGKKRRARVPSPVIVPGYKILVRLMKHAPYTDRKAIAIEIGKYARHLPEFLERSTETRRRR